MICAQAIVHFRPQESYEKYLKLLVSVMILIQLFLPVGSFFMAGDSRETVRQLEAFRESLEEGMRLAEEQAAETDRILEQMTLEEIRKRIEEQAGEEKGIEKPEEKEETGATAGMEKITVEMEAVEPVVIQEE